VCCSTPHARALVNFWSNHRTAPERLSRINTDEYRMPVSRMPVPVPRIRMPVPVPHCHLVTSTGTCCASGLAAVVACVASGERDADACAVASTAAAAASTAGTAAATGACCAGGPAGVGAGVAEGEGDAACGVARSAKAVCTCAGGLGACRALVAARLRLCTKTDHRQLAEEVEVDVRGGWARRVERGHGGAVILLVESAVQPRNTPERRRAGNT
jgi:hypothetical protein